MSSLRIRDLADSTHSGPEGHGHVRVRCHPMDGLGDNLQGYGTPFPAQPVLANPNAVQDALLSVNHSNHIFAEAISNLGKPINIYI